MFYIRFSMLEFLNARMRLTNVHTIPLKSWKMNAWSGCEICKIDTNQIISAPRIDIDFIYSYYSNILTGFYHAQHFQMEIFYV